MADASIVVPNTSVHSPASRSHQREAINVKPSTLAQRAYTSLVLLSGLEPQRTIFEQELLQRFADTHERVLLVRGKVSDPHTVIQRGNITILPSITDDDLRTVVQEVHTIIARSGYSTIMDLEALGVLRKAEFHPTPGQSEQEYLSSYLSF